MCQQPCRCTIKQKAPDNSKRSSDSQTNRSEVLQQRRRISITPAPSFRLERRSDHLDAARKRPPLKSRSNRDAIPTGRLKPMSSKGIFVGLVLLTFFLGYVHAGNAEETKGPKEMTLQTEKDKASTPKPATFSHAQHQQAFQCATCHHSGKDGKQTPYVAGMPIQKCETCHYVGSAGMPTEDNSDQGIVKLDTFKDAAHARCRTCHNATKAKNPELKDKWKGCLPCHN
jgi:hypothetical protein